MWVWGLYYCAFHHLSLDSGLNLFPPLPSPSFRVHHTPLNARPTSHISNPNPVREEILPQPTDSASGLRSALLLRQQCQPYSRDCSHLRSCVHLRVHVHLCQYRTATAMAPAILLARVRNRIRDRGWSLGWGWGWGLSRKGCGRVVGVGSGGDLAVGGIGGMIDGEGARMGLMLGFSSVRSGRRGR